MKKHVNPLLLSRLADGDLGADERRTVLAHTDDCSECSSKLEDIKNLSAVTRAINTAELAEMIKASTTNALATHRLSSVSSFLHFAGESRYLRAAALVVVSVVATVTIMNYLSPQSLPHAKVFYSMDAMRLGELPLGAISYYETVAGTGIVSTGCISVSQEPLGSLFEKTVSMSSMEINIDN